MRGSYLGFVKMLLNLTTKLDTNDDALFTLDVKLVLNENLGGILGGNPMLI
jgi:hypothetical protein